MAKSVADERRAQVDDQLSGLAGNREQDGNRFARRLLAEKKALFGCIFILLLLVLTLIGPWIAPYHPDRDDFGLFNEPSLNHPFGTDSFGRDLFSRVLTGTRTSIVIGLSAAFIAMVIGVVLGILSAYYGGWVDSVIMRFVDLLWAFPVIILAVAMVAVFGTGARNVVIAIAIAFVDDFARVVRSEVLSLRSEEFVVAARSVGARDSRIMARHILPNTAAPIIVQVTFAVALGILAEAGLTFLGLGVNPSTPTWGLLLNESRDFIRQAWWIGVFPGVAIMVTVLALNLFGDGLRDILDVRGVSEI